MNIEIDKIEEITLQETLVEYRRHIHSYPELGFKEFNTSNYIINILNELNIKTKKIGDTGIIADIGTANKCIALRAELDALPLTEQTELSFKSTIPGRMHACGHDMHMAILLGVAKILKKNENKIQGKVRLIFQPGEEVLPGGAYKMIEADILKDKEIKYIFAQHIDPMQDSGTICLPLKEAMASTNELFWTITGKAAHAAQPHLGNDAILAAVNIINFMQSLITKFRNPITPAIISICSINGGNTTNIFPNEVKMQGVMRTFDKVLRKELEELIINKSNDIAKLYNTSCSIDIVHGYPALINNEKAVNVVKKATTNIFGKEKLKITDPKLLAEDFAYFSQKIPACFWFIGANNPNNTEKYTLHSPKLNPDENILIKGTKLFIEIVNVALNELNNK